VVSLVDLLQALQDVEVRCMKALYGRVLTSTRTSWRIWWIPSTRLPRTRRTTARFPTTKKVKRIKETDVSSDLVKDCGSPKEKPPSSKLWRCKEFEVVEPEAHCDK